MWDSFIWLVFCAPLHLRLLLLCAALSTKLAVLNCPVSPLLCSPPPCATPVQCYDSLCCQLLSQGERSDPVLFHYNRAELLSVTPARLTSDLTRRLRVLEIGVSLPRKRYKRKCHRPNELKLKSQNAQSCRDLARDVPAASLCCVTSASPCTSSKHLHLLSPTTTPPSSASSPATPPPSSLSSPTVTPLLPSSASSPTTPFSGPFSTFPLPATSASPSPSATATPHLPDSPPSPTNSSPPSNELTVCLFNAQSVRPDQKTDFISDHVFDKDYDLVFLTETWLRPKGDEPIIKQLTPPGYKHHSHPRATLGGGILVLFKDVLEPALSFSSEFPFPHVSFEALEVVLNISGQTVIFVCLYRPPPSRTNHLTNTMFHNEIIPLLDYYSLRPGKLILLGDINFHFDNQNSYDTKRICSSLSDYSLTQFVSGPTHKKGHTLDWFVGRVSDHLVTSVLVTDELSSDHFAVVSSLNLSKPKRIKRTVTRRKLSSINPQNFASEAATRLSQNTDSSDPVSSYNTVLRQLLDEHAPPTTRVLPDRPPAPWRTPDIAEAKRACRRAERRWRSTKLEVFKQIYHQHRNKLKKTISAAKAQYHSSQVLKCTTTKDLYSAMADLLGTTKTSPLPSVYSPSKLPTVFSTFFAKKVTDLRDKLNQTPFHPSPPDPWFSGQPLVSFHPVSQSEVASILKEMSLKSCELDPIPASLFSQCIPQLLPSITDIINSSLLSGSFPTDFKTAFVRPLLKKSNLDPNILKNYRPVSNLPFLSKLLEKVVLKQLNSHLESNNLTHPFQSAYRANHSTETALLHIVSKLLKSSDSGKISLLTLLDLSAAFDTIDHSILITRLQHTFGIQHTALSWFKSYLQDRFQSVVVNGAQSDPVKLSCGVPQGSVLGPVLFTLYTAPLANIIDQHRIDHHFYADDTQLQTSATPDNISTVLTTTSACYSSVENWMTENKLLLNGDKTEAMLVGTKQQLSKITTKSIHLGQHSIPLSDSVKNLGVTLDRSLTMENFISQTVQSCFCQIRRIGHVRKYLSTEAVKKLVTSLVLSRLDYCNSLLSGLPASSIHRLQRIQNTAARLVLKKKKSDRVAPLLYSLHWLPVPLRISYKLNTLCYKCLNNSAPSYLSDSISLYTPPRLLRSAADTLHLRIDRYNLSTFGRRSFSLQGPLSWNDLPLSLRKSSTLPTFKSNLKTHLFLKQ